MLHLHEISTSIRSNFMLYRKFKVDSQVVRLSSLKGKLKASMIAKKIEFIQILPFMYLRYLIFLEIYGKNIAN